MQEWSSTEHSNQVIDKQAARPKIVMELFAADESKVSAGLGRVSTSHAFEQGHPGIRSSLTVRLRGKLNDNDRIGRPTDLRCRSGYT